MEEIWNDVIGFEGLYQASNLGNVKSIERTVVAPCRWGGERKMTFQEKIVKQFKTNSGYLKVMLSKNGIRYNKDVHRLVYEAFNGIIPKGMYVNHKDECKTNNVLTNLEIMTPSENINYGTAIDRMKETKRGKKNLTP